MPGAGFKTFTAGEVFTATDANTYLMQQAVMVFTNEAARDAAITSPSEGMHAYLTTPTTYAATGGITAGTTGVNCVHNGSKWVCISPVTARTNDNGSTTSTSYTSTLSGGGTNPSVTLETGTTALVTLGLHQYVEGAAANCFMSVAVSGATTLAAADDKCLAQVHTGTGNQNTLGSQIVLTGLTAGVNTFTLQYRVSAQTGRFIYRTISVVGLL